MRRLANLVSIVVHPLLMPTMVFWLIFHFAPIVAIPFNQGHGFYIVALVFLLTCIFPLIYVAVLKFTSMISSFHMAERKERLIPFGFISLFYIALIFVLAPKLEVNPVFVVILIAIAVLVTLLTLITAFWKVSIHSAACAGLAGFILGINMHFPDNELLWPLIVVVLLGGVVMSSRLYLGAHRLREVVVGAGLGFVVSFGAAFFL